MLAGNVALLAALLVGNVSPHAALLVGNVLLLVLSCVQHSSQLAA